MPEHIQRSEGSRLFGGNSAAYDAARPDYPAWVFTQLSGSGILTTGTATLEIGAGSGKATRALLERGADPLTLIEPDARFVPQLSRLTDQFAARCTIVTDRFEDAHLRDGEFQLVMAATSFHWIEPGNGLRKVRRVLRHGGTAVLVWHVFQQLGAHDAFHEATRSLLENLAVSPSGTPNSVPFALDREARREDALAAGFSDVEYAESRWTLTLDAAQVGALYGGFASIERLDPEPRRALLERLVTIASTTFEGRVERPMTTCMYLLS